MAHILDPVHLANQRQELGRQLQAHELTPAEYKQAMRLLGAELAEAPKMCANGDGRQAHMMIDQRPLCAPCILLMKRGRA